MTIKLPMAKEEEMFEQVDHQGKTIKIGDSVLVLQAGQQQEVVVSSLVKKQNHYWVGYNNDKQYCPWPLVRRKQP